jgi:hypothetical protein
MIRALALASVVVATLVLAPAAQAADPTGTWKWSTTFNNQTRETTLKLKLEDGKLTGAILGRNDQETPIEDAKIDGDKISFSVTRGRGEQKFTSKYSGTVSGDTIKGTIESPGRDGQTRSREWEAKKAS